MPVETYSETYVLGYNGHLYFADSLFADADDFITATYTEVDEIGDVNLGGDPETVDISNRAVARSGFSAEVDVVEKGELTFPLQVNPQSTIWKKFLKAKINKTSISLLDLNLSKDTDGAYGFCGNFTINFGHARPLKGVQVVNVTAKLNAFGQWVEVYDNASTPTLRVIDLSGV